VPTVFSAIYLRCFFGGFVKRKTYFQSFFQHGATFLKHGATFFQHCVGAKLLSSNTCVGGKKLRSNAVLSSSNTALKESTFPPTVEHFPPTSTLFLPHLLEESTFPPTVDHFPPTSTLFFPHPVRGKYFSSNSGSLFSNEYISMPPSPDFQGSVPFAPGALSPPMMMMQQPNMHQ
jgi:hypothetical protein